MIYIMIEEHDDVAFDAKVIEEAVVVKEIDRRIKVRFRKRPDDVKTIKVFAVKLDIKRDRCFVIGDKRGSTIKYADREDE